MYNRPYDEPNEIFETEKNQRRHKNSQHIALYMYIMKYG